MNTETTFQHIISTPDVCGGKPRIDGRRITVQSIVIWHEQMGYSVDEIATLHNLTLSEIYSALAYYQDHRAEIDESIEQGEAYAEALRTTTPSLVAQRLYERTG
jgi:uncharacterized protein (DUF433 family)